MPQALSRVSFTPETMAPPSQTLSPRKSVGESFQDALKILVTMVQNQSPDQPMDAKEFGDQIIRFMTVEQNMKTNENLNHLIKLQNTGQAISALPLVGREAVVDGQVFEQGTHPVHIQYEFPQTPKAALMMVFDHHKNRVVRHISNIPTDAGAYEIPFDGLGDDGQPLPPGVYRAVLLAKDEQDQDIEPKLWIRSKVTGIRHQDGKPLLLFGDAGHTLDKIIEVRQDAPPALVPPKPHEPEHD